jgi:hypothetical protein
VRSAERATAALAKHEHELVGLARTDPLRAVELNMLVARMKAKCDVALELVGAMRARLAEIERVNAPDACAPRVVSRNRRKRDG